MIKMPQARDLITHWIRGITQGSDVTESFNKLRDDIQEAKKVWEEAARSLAGPKQGTEILQNHPEYQRLIVLESLRQDIYLLWADKYVLNLSASRGHE